MTPIPTPIPGELDTGSPPMVAAAPATSDSEAVGTPAVAEPPAPQRTIDPAAVGTKRGAFKVTETGVTWTCGRCDTENSMEAAVCVVCGADLATTLRPPEPERPQRDPNMVAMLSLFMPGAGHAYLGQWPQGVARAVVQLWMLATVVIGAVQGSPLVWLTFGAASFGLWMIAAHDAYREATDKGRGVILQGRMFLWLVLGLLGLLLLVVVATAMRAPNAISG
jgi:hypothetical protein